MKINFKMLLPILMFLAVSAITGIAQESPAKPFLNTSARNFYIRAYLVTANLTENDIPTLGFGGETKYLNGLFSNREKELTSDDFYGRISKAEKQNINVDRQIMSLYAAENETGQTSIGSIMVISDAEKNTMTDVLADGIKLAASVIGVENESGKVVSVELKYDVKGAVPLDKEMAKIQTWGESGKASFPIGKFYLVSAKKDSEAKKETLLFVEVSEIVFKKSE
jgi:hypothetical protein